MPIEPTPFKPGVERRREILHGTPGVVIYQDGKPVLWIPDNFGSLTKSLPPKELKVLHAELKRYLGLERGNDGPPDPWILGKCRHDLDVISYHLGGAE